MDLKDFLGMGMNKKKESRQVSLSHFFFHLGCLVQGRINVSKCMGKNVIFSDSKPCHLKIHIKRKYVKCRGFYWFCSLIGPNV